MWHELVLNGIGGRTIAEAKETLSYREACAWFEYIRKRGSLNIGRRIECAVALLAVQQNRYHGGDADMSDFMPHEDEPQASLNDVMSALGAIPAKPRE